MNRFERITTVQEAQPPIHTNGNHPLADDGATPIDQLSALDQFLVKTPATDYGNALCVQRLYGDRFASNEGFGLMFFDGKRWTRHNAESMLSDCVIKTLRRRGKLSFDHDKPELTKKSTLNNANINACIARFLALPEIYQPVAAFDAHPHLLNCNNGTVDLRTGDLLKHDPHHLITQLVNYDYKPDSPQGSWLSFLANVIGDYKNYNVADYVKMLAGYTATGETREQILVYLLGERGRNGKGVFVDVIQKLLGDYATGAEFSTLTRKRDGGDQGFDIAALRGSRWVVTSESGKEDRLNEAKVKQLTGQDTITAAHKNRDPFQFKPAFTVWALSNHEPKGDVDDDAFWNRIKIVNFPHSFAGREDKNLRERLMTTEVLESVLAWIIEGAIMWYALDNSGLQTPESVTAQVTDTRERQDSVRAWIKDDAVTTAGSFCNSGVLYSAYQRWCEGEERDDLIKGNAFSKRLVKLGFKATKRRINGQEQRGFIGIRPKEPAERGETAD